MAPALTTPTLNLLTHAALYRALDVSLNERSNVIYANVQLLQLIYIPSLSKVSRFRNMSLRLHIVNNISFVWFSCHVPYLAESPLVAAPSRLELMT